MAKQARRPKRTKGAMEKVYEKADSIMRNLGTLDPRLAGYLGDLVGGSILAELPAREYARVTDAVAGEPLAGKAQERSLRVQHIERFAKSRNLVYGSVILRFLYQPKVGKNPFGKSGKD